MSIPNISGNEGKYVKECIDTEWVSSAGKYVNLFEEKISNYTKSKYAIACVNGTSALQVSLILGNIQSGDEIIMPTLTFIASVNSAAYNQLSPIFMDCDDYYNIDIEKTIEFINKETVFKNGFTINKTTKKKIAAIMPVHVWGNAALLKELVPICKDRNIIIVEDASESLGTFYSSKSNKKIHTGTVGDFGCISFNGNKIITTGGGGVILTKNKKLADRARYLTTQAKDDPVKYIHNNIGYNFRLTNVQAAIGVAQLEQLPHFLNKKKTIFNHYVDQINKIEGLGIAPVPSYSLNNHWMNVLQIEKDVYGKNSEELMLYLKKMGIETRPVWTLNHKQKPYKKFQKYNIDKANKLYKKSLCLPSSTNLKADDIQKIIECLKIK